MFPGPIPFPLVLAKKPLATQNFVNEDSYMSSAGEVRGGSIELPNEVFLPLTDSTEVERIALNRLGIAGFVVSEGIIKPLLVLDGEPKDSTDKKDYLQTEYYDLSLNIFDNTVLRSGWGNLVITPDGGRPYAWAYNDHSTVTYIRNKPERYSNRKLQKMVDFALKQARSAEHVSRINLAPPQD